eukprot:scaffold187_cov101-Skeletonema_dohrnii-CCMP3373.AAC.5
MGTACTPPRKSPPKRGTPKSPTGTKTPSSTTQLLSLRMQWVKGDVCLVRIEHSSDGRAAYLFELKNAIGDLIDLGIPILGIVSCVDNKGDLLRNSRNYVVQGVLFTVDLEGDETDEAKRQIVREIAEKIGDLYCKVTKPFSNATTKAKPFSYRVGYCDMSEKCLDQIVHSNILLLPLPGCIMTILQTIPLIRMLKALLAHSFKEDDDFDKAKAEVLNAYEAHVKDE